MDLDDVADALYAVPPEEFVQARDDAAKQATDPALRKAIKALRRPTAPAYAVNALVRERSHELDELLELGEQMRAAMTGTGGDVRALTEQRRTLISSLVDAELPANVRDDVTATLEAATADPELAGAVRTGRLVKPLRYAGFGAMPDLEDALATPIARAGRPATKRASPAKRTAPATTRKAPPAQKVGAAPAELSAARERVLELAGAADDAQRRFDAAVRAAAQARAVLEEAEAERAAAHKAAREAHAAAERARRDLGRLERS